MECQASWPVARLKRARSSFDDHGTTFMPCSAKLPIIALVAGAFFLINLVAPSAYFLGMTAIIFSGISLKNTFVCWRYSSFIMELPAYHFPQWSAVLRQTYDRSKSLLKAGTIIFVSSIVIWFSSSYNFMLNLFLKTKVS